MTKSALPCAVVGAAMCLSGATVHAEETRVTLEPKMVTVDGDALGDPTAMVDEQDKIGDPPAAPAKTGWMVPSQHWKEAKTWPANATIDLGEEMPLSAIWFYDTNGIEDVIVSAGKPGEWTEVTKYALDAYQTWKSVPLDVKTRYLRIGLTGGGANFTEIAVYRYDDKQWAQVQQTKVEDAKAAAEKDAAIAKAKQEEANRPTMDIGAPFGEVTLVDEVDLSQADMGHMFQESPQGVSKVETILGKPARVLSKTPDEGAYISFRMGQYKLLKPGGTYVLEVEYPEDVARSMVVQNGGNEVSRGFYTGQAVGDALHPKYVNNLNESLDVPLSGKYQTFQLMFNLHDRFPDHGLLRGDLERALTTDDGFWVTIAQYSADNLPLSAGAAVSRIRLYEVKNPDALKAKLNLPPEGLPRRHLFWREEMADGMAQNSQDETRRATKTQLDWWKYKANQMEFLGMHTYTKDLLEFGAVQHWDTSSLGGNSFAYFDSGNKDLWNQIVTEMGERGFDIFPYYEYAGSKGQNGLGNERRAKPLTRDDAYTHIKWIETANADITDPDTIENFKKVLDVTIIQNKDKANFIGAWIRPRAQIPMGFGPGALKRFSADTNDGKEVTRKDLIADETLLAKYREWWFGKRQEFLVAVRDHLRSNGIEDATVLYTTVSSEPGAPWTTPDAPTLVTDSVQKWQELLAKSDHKSDAEARIESLDDVKQQDLYLKALTQEQTTWGGWEWNHANPPPDPQNYKDTDGILFSHAINRLFTVNDPRTFDAFREPAGLAVMRFYSLNENMLFDKEDKPKLGYFIADTERAGPYSMMPEAMAMANGDPTYIGYLVGSNFGRGFPRYVRDFNTAFLSLPALPSERLSGVASDEQVVVRKISTDDHGTWFAVVNTSMKDVSDVQLNLGSGKITDSATGEPVSADGGKVTLTLYPYQLRAFHVE